MPRLRPVSLVDTILYILYIFAGGIKFMCESMASSRLCSCPFPFADFA